MPEISPRLTRQVSLAVLVLASVACKSRPQYDPSVQKVADDLHAADSTFASASARNGYFETLELALTDRARMPIQNGQFADTRREVVDALRSSTPARARVNWAPLRVGVAADANHGFSYGTMTVTDTSGHVRHARYLAYWLRTANGWRMAAYRRRFADSTHAQRAVAPWLPRALVSESSAGQVAAHHRSLVAAEKQFSDEAQQIGLGAAFQKFGRVDAVNLGPPGSPTFILGSNAIGVAVAGPDPLTAPSPVYWSADTALVASSGDLGITFGVIRRHGAPSNTPGASFFTIWIRESPEARWQYIAE